MQYRIEINQDESVLVEVPDQVVLHEPDIEAAVDSVQRKKLPETRAQGVADALGGTLVDSTAAYVGAGGVLSSDIVSISKAEYEELIRAKGQ